MKKTVHIFLILCVMIFALAVRIYHIDTAPPSLYPDEANNAINARDAWQGHHYQWFYPDNNGREGLYINMMALSMKYFGINVFAIKLPSIILGVLSVLGIYLLTRALFPSRWRIAFIAAYLSAGSFWLINFSRIGFRAILMLPILTFSFYFFFRAISTKHYSNFLVSGMIFGLGFHSYIAFRIAPALLLTLLFLLTLIETRAVKRLWKGLLLFGIGAVVTAAPMFWTLHQHPQYATARTSEVSIFHTQDRASIPHQLLTSTALALGKYTFYGDPNFRHNYAPYPQLEPLTSIAFLAGIIITISGFFRLITLRFRRDVRNRNLVIYGFLLAWFIAFLAPEFLTKEGLPHALRSIGTLPVVYIFAALGINALYEWILYKRRQTKNILLVIMAFLLLFIGVFNTIKYHVFWAHNPKTAIAFHEELRDVADALKHYPAYKEKIIVTGWLTRLSIDIFAQDVDHRSYVHPDHAHDITLGENTIVFLPTPDQKIIDEITRNNPHTNLIIEKHPQRDGLSFVTIRRARNYPINVTFLK